MRDFAKAAPAAEARSNSEVILTVADNGSCEDGAEQWDTDSGTLVGVYHLPFRVKLVKP